MSDKAYDEVIIAGYSFILMTKLHFLHHQKQPLELWTWNSNFFEDIFYKKSALSQQK